MKEAHKHLYFMCKMPKQGRSKATIDSIISATTRILLEVGYDKSSTNKIANLAGISIGSLYEYFPGKEAIYAKVRRREDQRLFDLTMSHAQPFTKLKSVLTCISETTDVASLL